MENKILLCTSAAALQHNVSQADYNSVFQQNYTSSKLLDSELFGLSDLKIMSLFKLSHLLSVHVMMLMFYLSGAVHLWLYLINYAYIHSIPKNLRSLP